MDEIEQKLQEAQNDNKRAQAGMVFGRSEDYQYAHNLLQDSISRHNSLSDEKKRLQDIIEALHLSGAKLNHCLLQTGDLLSAIAKR
jgi:hypothetical protein